MIDNSFNMPLAMFYKYAGGIAAVMSGELTPEEAVAVCELDDEGFEISEEQLSVCDASDYDVPQLRPRVAIVGIRKDIKGVFFYRRARKNSSDKEYLDSDT